MSTYARRFRKILIGIGIAIAIGVDIWAINEIVAWVQRLGHCCGN
jgi:uncharacterized membrane protein